MKTIVYETFKNNLTPNAVQQIRSVYVNLRQSEKKVADYILQNIDVVIESSISEIAKKSNVSEATVIRFSKSSGFSGLQDLKLSLAKSSVGHNTSKLFENISNNDDLETAIKKTFTNNITSINHTLQNINLTQLKFIGKKISANKILFLYGLGTSGLVAEYASYRFTRMGKITKEFVTSHSIALSTTIASAGDIAIFVSQSGSTKEVVEAIKELKKNDVYVITVTGHLDSPAAKASDIVIRNSVHETPFESGGIRSLLAQLSAIDAIMVAVAMENFNESIYMIQKTAEALKSKKY